MTFVIPSNEKIDGKVGALVRAWKAGKLPIPRPRVFTHLESPAIDPIIKAYVAHHVSKLTREELVRQVGRIYAGYKYMHDRHEGQLRDDGKPYIVHTATVGLWLAQRGFNASHIIGALNHDVVEDCGVPLEDLRQLEDSRTPGETPVMDVVNYATKPIPRSSLPIDKDIYDAQGNQLVQVHWVRRPKSRKKEKMVVVFPASEHYQTQETVVDARQKNEQRDLLTRIQNERIVPQHTFIDVGDHMSRGQYSSHLAALGSKQGDVLSFFQTKEGKFKKIAKKKYDSLDEAERRELAEKELDKIQADSGEKANDPKATIEWILDDWKEKGIPLTAQERKSALKDMIRKRKRTLDTFAPFGRAFYDSLDSETRKLYDRMREKAAQRLRKKQPRNIVKGARYRSIFRLNSPRDRLNHEATMTLGKAWEWEPQTYQVSKKRYTGTSQTQVERLFHYHSIIGRNYAERDVDPAYERLGKELYYYLAPSNERKPRSVAFQDWKPDTSRVVKRVYSLMMPGDRDRFLAYGFNLGHIHPSKRHRYFDLATCHALVHQASQPITKLDPDIQRKLFHNTDGLRWIPAPWRGPHAYTLFLAHDIFGHNPLPLESILGNHVSGENDSPVLLQSADFEGPHHTNASFHTFEVELNPAAVKRRSVDSIIKGMCKQLKAPKAAYRRKVLQKAETLFVDPSTRPSKGKVQSTARELESLDRQAKRKRPQPPL